MCYLCVNVLLMCQRVTYVSTCYLCVNVLLMCQRAKLFSKDKACKQRAQTTYTYAHNIHKGYDKTQQYKNTNTMVHVGHVSTTTVFSVNVLENCIFFWERYFISKPVSAMLAQMKMHHDL